jgi:hypothetical protein
VSDQPPPLRGHQLSEAQRLMGQLRAAEAGDVEFVPTDAMYRLADLLTNRIRQLEGELAQAQSALQHANARVGFYTNLFEGQQGLDRQIEKATPPKQPTEDGGAS